MRKASGGGESPRAPPGWRGRSSSPHDTDQRPGCKLALGAALFGAVVDAVLLDLLDQRRSADSQQIRQLGLVALGLNEAPPNHFPLERLYRRSELTGGNRVSHQQSGVGAQQARAADEVGR